MILSFRNNFIKYAIPTLLLFNISFSDTSTTNNFKFSKCTYFNIKDSVTLDKNDSIEVENLKYLVEFEIDSSTLFVDGIKRNKSLKFDKSTIKYPTTDTISFAFPIGDIGINDLARIYFNKFTTNENESYIYFGNYLEPKFKTIIYQFYSSAYFCRNGLIMTNCSKSKCDFKFYAPQESEI